MMKMYWEYLILILLALYRALVGLDVKRQEKRHQELKERLEKLEEKFAEDVQVMCDVSDQLEEVLTLQKKG